MNQIPPAGGEQVLVGRIFVPKRAPAALVGAELAKLKSERGQVIVVGNEIFVEDYPSVIGGQTQKFQTLESTAVEGAAAQ